MKTVIFIVLLSFFGLVVYIWLGRCVSCFLSLILQKGLWELCRGTGGAFKEEKSGVKMRKCKLSLCKAARDLGFDVVAKYDIEDHSKNHPRWFKWLQIGMVILWPLFLSTLVLFGIIALLWRILVLPKTMLEEFLDWWN